MSCQTHYICGTDCKGLEKLQKELEDSRDFIKTLTDQFEKLEIKHIALVEENERLLRNERNAGKDIALSECKKELKKSHERVKELHTALLYIAKDSACEETDCGLDQADIYVEKAREALGIE